MSARLQTLVLAGALTLLAGCTRSDSPQKKAEESLQTSEWAANHVDAEGAARLLAKAEAIVVLDVRTSKEFKQGRVPGARLINYYDDDFADQLGELDRGAPYLVYCQGGGRSRKTLPLLEQLGFTQVTHLDGGFSAWDEADLPYEQ